ncbi:hypothetical protein AMAG_15688 [Allomyces macrogynus ATCC 38327]|uniref:Uncharacterized protein n=1 Tax=Allomyces macrogynus (strain ATCC 38327) TaxID=578462 RepID=A0A0L0T9L2_ALLM3|nr:hypothetical protein AMAG_15688 [Allomyces macrogynus ATCC 38327]|eukprot:KNE71458.1 hypothetical protein AMAG_15688 [Allomyces macrogynus ATCC 38327]
MPSSTAAEAAAAATPKPAPPTSAPTDPAKFLNLFDLRATTLAMLAVHTFAPLIPLIPAAAAFNDLGPAGLALLFIAAIQVVATGVGLWGTAKRKAGIVNAFGLRHGVAAVASTAMVLVRTGERSVGANIWWFVSGVLVVLCAWGCGNTGRC